MLTTLYPFFYLASLSGLVLWFFYQGKPGKSRFFSTVFLLGFLGYLFSLAFAEADFNLKLWTLFRDMSILGLTSQVFIWTAKKKWIFWGLLFLCYGIFFAFGKDYMRNQIAQQVSVIERPDISKDGEILVELTDKKFFNEFKDWLGKSECTVSPAFDVSFTKSTQLDEFVLVNTPNDIRLPSLMESVSNLSYVVAIEYNENITVSPLKSVDNFKNPITLSNDPLVDQQWALSTLQAKEVHQLLKKIKPKKKVLVAVLDTGIDGKHEDLNASFISHGKRHDKDDVGHGTHCAGIIAGTTNNERGIASLLPNNEFINITSIKVLNGFGSGTQDGIIKGIVKAAEAGADVISMSLGGRSNDKRQRAYAEAVRYANSLGAIVVVAAGNSNSPSKGFAPANTPGVITVTAIDANLAKASFSNTVSGNIMALAAPGAQILSTTPSNEYKSFNGTSMATPYVSSLVAIIKSIDPSIDTKSAFKLMNSSGKRVDDSKRIGTLIQPANTIKLISTSPN